MSATAVELEGLTRRFDAARILSRVAAIVALDRVDLVIAPGEVLGLLGPNGAGKTTLLEILATVLLPTAGTARVGAYDVVRDAPRVRECTAYCPAGASSFFPRLSGRQNLEFFLALANLSRAETHRRADEAAEAVHLTEILPRQVRAYSDGMRQRLALARAIGTDASLWLLDEPTRSLDPEAQRTFRALIRQLARERDVTVIVATHDLGEAAELCDRIAVLRRGRVAVCDRPADLVARHGSLAAAYRSAAEGRD